MFLFHISLCLLIGNVHVREMELITECRHKAKKDWTGVEVVADDVELIGCMMGMVLSTTTSHVQLG